jgi:hypothetical protein
VPSLGSRMVLKCVHSFVVGQAVSQVWRSDGRGRAVGRGFGEVVSDEEDMDMDMAVGLGGFSRVVELALLEVMEFFACLSWTLSFHFCNMQSRLSTLSSMISASRVMVVEGLAGLLSDVVSVSRSWLVMTMNESELLTFPEIRSCSIVIARWPSLNTR